MRWFFRALGQIKREANIVQVCRRWGMPLWQCPETIFVGIGMLTVASIFGSYVIGKEQLEPEQLVVVVSAIAVLFLAASFIIVNSFERIAEANRLKSEFINIASHQLRSPLTAARWALSILAAGTAQKSSEEQRYVAIVSDALSRMRRMVSTMLGVARIEAGTVRRVGQRFSLRDLAQHVTDAFSGLANASNISLRFTAPNGSLDVIAGEEQVRYVLESLIDNAFRYMPGKGNIAVVLSQEGSEVRFSVSDTGMGIPAKDQRRIFEKFFRGENVFRVSPGGMGLSLFVTRAIIEAAGGSMGFLSSERGGSTFWFTLPAAPSLQKEPVSQAAPVLQS